MMMTRLLAGLLDEVHGSDRAAPLAAYRASLATSRRYVVGSLLPEVLDSDVLAFIERGIESGSYIDELERAGSVGGFGYSFGEAFLDHAAGAEYRHAAARAAALWNLLVAYFDLACDDYAGLRERLVAYVNDESLRDAADPSWTGRLRAEPAEPVLVHFVVQITDALLRAVRGATHPGSATLRAPFVGAMIRAYEAEVAFSRCRVRDAGDVESVRRLAEACGVLPVWLLGCLAMLLAGRGASWPDLEVHATRIGHVFWMVDDLVDLREDLEEGRWNYIHFLALEHDAQAFEMLVEVPFDQRVRVADDTGLALACAAAVLDEVRAARAALRRDFGTDSPLELFLTNMIREFVSSGIDLAGVRE